MDCNSTSMNPATYALSYARVHNGKLIVPFMLFASTVSNVQAPFVQFDALINRITDDNSKIIQCVHNPPCSNMHTEVDVGAWDTSIFE